MDKLKKTISYSRNNIDPVCAERHKLICSLFEEYIEIYALRDERLILFFSDDFKGYTGSCNTLIADKSKWIQITKQDLSQRQNKIGIEILDLSLQNLAENIVSITAFFHIPLSTSDKILSNKTARLVLIYRYENAAWKIVHSGTSIPYEFANNDEIYLSFRT